MSNIAKKEKTKKSPSDAKEQRKPRNNKTHVTSPAVKTEDKVPEKQNEEPGPEFYKNLKRETDEILKISEESNAKYNKRTIKSNWEKYELPIDTYEERVEVESQGANFDELVSTTITSGGHFQFKQEKSWDNVTEPSHYDKYFEIDMAKLAISLSSIPFHERNGLDPNLFTESDIISMTHRSKKFRQKGEKSPSESCDDPTEKLLNIMKENLVLNEKELQNTKSNPIEDVNFDSKVIESVTLNTTPSNVTISETQDLDKTKSLVNVSNKLSGTCGSAPENDDDLEEWLDDLLSAQ